MQAMKTSTATHLDEDLIKKLNKLIQLDIDAVFAYDQAIENIDIREIRSKISEFKSDHERHIRDLSTVVRSGGGTPPDRSKDFKGFLIEGFTRLRSSTGTEGALKAMKMNEETTNKKYQEALDWPLPVEVRQLIVKNREDERRHLSYIENVLREGVESA